MVLSGLLKVIFGLLLIIAGVFVVLSYPGWLQAVKDVVQGGIVVGLVLFGLLFLLLGFTDIGI
tara:strand:+ start:1704 stop:1892 length:189 start_codon:yes stop_codon:yes gene_type:complete